MASPSSHPDPSLSTRLSASQWDVLHVTGEVPALPHGVVDGWRSCFALGMKLHGGQDGLWRTLLEQSPSLVDLPLNDQGDTALTRLMDHRPMPWALIETLVMAGASTQISKGRGKEPIWATVVRSGHTGCVRALLARHAMGLPGPTPAADWLDLAIQGLRTSERGGRGHPDLPLLLLGDDERDDAIVVLMGHLGDHGVDLRGVDEEQVRRGTTRTVMHAIEAGLWRVAQGMIDAGAEPARVGPFRIRTDDLRTMVIDHGHLLHQAASRSSLEACRWLVEQQGLDPRIATTQGRSPLDLARSRPRPVPEVVAYLETLELRQTMSTVPVAAGHAPRARL